MGTAGLVFGLRSVVEVVAYGGAGRGSKGVVLSSIGEKCICGEGGTVDVWMWERGERFSM